MDAILPIYYQHFNPRPPRGGRPRITSIGDYTFRFQSTPPARGATDLLLHHRDPAGISIHAPREGGDDKIRKNFRTNIDFNPRPPRGGRPSSTTLHHL